MENTGSPLVGALSSDGVPEFVSGNVDESDVAIGVDKHLVGLAGDGESVEHVFVSSGRTDNDSSHSEGDSNRLLERA